MHAYMTDACPQPPVRFDRVWEGRGTERAFTLWRMVPPTGYVALGFVVTPSANQATHAGRCGVAFF